MHEYFYNCVLWLCAAWLTSGILNLLCPWVNFEKWLKAGGKLINNILSTWHIRRPQSHNLLSLVVLPASVRWCLTLASYGNLPVYIVLKSDMMWTFQKVSPLVYSANIIARTHHWTFTNWICRHLLSLWIWKCRNEWLQTQITNTDQGPEPVVNCVLNTGRVTVKWNWRWFEGPNGAG